MPIIDRDIEAAFSSCCAARGLDPTDATQTKARVKITVHRSGLTWAIDGTQVLELSRKLNGSEMVYRLKGVHLPEFCEAVPINVNTETQANIIPNHL